MNIINILFYMYVFCWITFIVGFIFIKTKTNSAKKLEKLIWNSRVDKFQKKPFSYVVEWYDKKNYFGLVVLVIILNLTMVILQSIIGFILISPIVIAILGFNAGALIAQADRKTMIFSLFVLIFELGSFSISGGIGFYIGAEWIFNKKPFFEILNQTIIEGYYLIPIVCLILNGIFEAMGIFFNIEGVPGTKAYKEKIYK